ncbi:hypothetical protein CL633_00295 [bacterium]|nr:hypothetical protein [bacterium]
MKKQEKLVIIDSNALVHRVYHALPRFTTPNGELVNAVYGFISVLLRVLNDLKPDYLVACFDVAGKTFRKEKFDQYKAKRVKSDQELYDQIPRIKQVLKVFNIPIFEKKGYEADDVIGTIVRKVRNSNLNVQSYIVTGDMDTLQLVNNMVKVYTLKRSINDTVIYDEKAVKDRFDGLCPGQMIDFKGLRGDASDNIPGVSGIGDVTGIKLLKKYYDLDGVYKIAHKIKKSGKKHDLLKGKLLENLISEEDTARFSKELATINCMVPIKFNFKKAIFKNFDIEKVKNILNKLGFNSLVRRLNDLMDKKQPAISLFDSQPGKRDQGLEKIERFYKDGILSKKAYELEKFLLPVICKMEKRGIKLDLARLEKIKYKLDKSLESLTKNIYKLANQEFNINSSQQLSNVLFNKLNLSAKGIKKTPKGVISTAAPQLQKLQSMHKIIPLIEKYREFNKLKTTYVNALPKLVKSDNRVHGSFDQLGTATGRISSKDPNLQNIPVRTAWGREVRKAFISEPGSLLVSADYSQIELRIAAAIAKDAKMIQAFRDDEDIHARTAAEIFNIKINKVNKDQRRQAKTLNFGVLYGMGARSFAQSAKMSIDQARSFIEDYMMEFGSIANYVQDIKQKAKNLGHVKTLLGRKRFLPEINSYNPRIRAMSERMAVNHPIQGTAADIIKIAMIRIPDKFNLILQIHDELLFEINKKDIKSFSKQIKKIMEKAYDLDRVDLKVDLQYGKNWGDLKDMDI